MSSARSLDVTSRSPSVVAFGFNRCRLALLGLVHLLVGKLDFTLKNQHEHLERLDAGGLLVASFIKLALRFLKELVQGVQNITTLVPIDCQHESCFFAMMPMARSKVSMVSTRSFLASTKPSISALRLSLPVEPGWQHTWQVRPQSQT